MRRESHPRRLLGRSRIRIGFLVYAGPHPLRSAVDMLHNPLSRVICLANSPGALVRLTLHEVAPEAGLAPAPHRLTGERATLTPLWIANWRRGWESRPRRFLGRTWLPT